MCCGKHAQGKDEEVDMEGAFPWPELDEKFTAALVKSVAIVSISAFQVLLHPLFHVVLLSSPLSLHRN